MKKIFKSLIGGIVASGVVYGIMWILCNMVEWICGNEQRMAIAGIVGFVLVLKALMVEE